MDIDRDTAPESAPDVSRQAEPEGSNDRTPSRRKLFKLAATAAPVVVAMSSRPAWACNPMMPSVFCSVYTANLKHISLSHDATKTGKKPGTGCSSSYWKCFYKTSSSWGCDTSNCNRLVKSTGTLSSCLGTSKAPKKSFGELFHGGGSAADCRYAAAYLNCYNNGWNTYSRVSNYPLTVPDLCSMYNGTYKVGGSVWTQAECLQYLEWLENDPQGLIPTGIKYA